MNKEEFNEQIQEVKKIFKNVEADTLKKELVDNLDIFDKEYYKKIKLTEETITFLENKKVENIELIIMICINKMKELLTKKEE